MHDTDMQNNKTGTILSSYAYLPPSPPTQHLLVYLH